MWISKSVEIQFLMLRIETGASVGLHVGRRKPSTHHQHPRKRAEMNENSTLVRKRCTEIGAVRERGENKITPDLPESLAPAFWSTAWITLPEGQTSVHLRLDSDVAQWFKAAGRGHRTLINDVLRAYFEAQKQTSNPSSPELARARPASISNFTRHTGVDAPPSLRAIG